MASRAGKLLFAPKAKDDHPLILMYAAIPMLDEDLELRMSMKEEYGLGVRFLGTPDGTAGCTIRDSRRR